MNCEHCQREIIQREGQWIDPAATGDDQIWGVVCDSNDTFQAEHTPQLIENSYFHEQNETPRFDYLSCRDCGQPVGHWTYGDDNEMFIEYWTLDQEHETALCTDCAYNYNELRD